MPAVGVFHRIRLCGVGISVSFAGYDSARQRRFFESRLVAMGAWLVGAGLADGAGQSAGAFVPEAAGGHGGALAGFVVWLAVVPVVGKWGEPFWRGDSKLFAEVMADAAAESLAVERFVSFHTAWLWAGLGILAWAVARRICHRNALKAP